jgi:hypothetical protein
MDISGELINVYYKFISLYWYKWKLVSELIKLY